MTHVSRRNSRAYSILSGDNTNIPRPAPPPTRRSGTRGVHATSFASDAASTDLEQTAHIPSHYRLAPTAPSPFIGSLEASLDAILLWGRTFPNVTVVVSTLLKPVSRATDWPVILQNLLRTSSTLHPRLGRFLLEEFLFLVTRVLLPEQIAENRTAMARLYNRKKQLAIRLVLRYDMMREWCSVDGTGRKDVSVASLPPDKTAVISNKLATSNLVDECEDVYQRRCLMPNIWPTLIAAPDGGWTTHGVRERMKHYVTPLDSYLLLSDEEVKQWSDMALVVKASQVVLQWQWLREKNATLEDMERSGWEELDGRAEECEWIAEKREVLAGRCGRAGEDGM